MVVSFNLFFFFFNDTATTEIYTLSLHDALTICEDVWLPDWVAEAAALGASCVLNISASPYHVGKGHSREEMLATRARDGLCAVAYCNLVGGQDELVFDGRSAVFGPDGSVLARAASFAEE